MSAKTSMRAGGDKNAGRWNPHRSGIGNSVAIEKRTRWAVPRRARAILVHHTPRYATRPAHVFVPQAPRSRQLSPPGTLPGLDGVEAYLPYQGLIAGILADPIETRVDAQEHEPRGTFLERDVEPPERLVHVTQARVERGDTPRRDHALRAGLGQFLKDTPRRGLVPAAGLEVPETERGPRNATAHPPALLVLAAGLVQLQRLQSGRAGLRIRLGRLSHSSSGADVVTVCDSRPRRSVCRIEL